MPLFKTGEKRKFTFGVKEDKPEDITPIPVGEKPVTKGTKVLEQTGKSIDLLRDAARGARLPGKRISKTGKVYWETRQNRSDQLGKNI